MFQNQMCSTSSEKLFEDRGHSDVVRTREKLQSVQSL